MTAWDKGNEILKRLTWNTSIFREQFAVQDISWVAWQLDTEKTGNEYTLSLSSFFSFILFSFLLASSPTPPFVFFTSETILDSAERNLYIPQIMNGLKPS